MSIFVGSGYGIGRGLWGIFGIVGGFVGVALDYIPDAAGGGGVVVHGGIGIGGSYGVWNKCISERCRCHQQHHSRTGYLLSDVCGCRTIKPGRGTNSAWTADAASERAKVNSKLRFRMLDDGREDGSSSVVMDGRMGGWGGINE